ncbi:MULTISPECIES: hypothetical protein [unclassified Nonomuraea]|uniref:hypothetical protein n=1 Tax=unclassified Nonomuraea TaxID=2593643 RepID=UPI001F2F1B57|nr:MULTISPECIES: hypothetical protein [unclassified Nonomuraea]
MVTKQAGIGIIADWGGSLVASTDGLRFVVQVRSCIRARRRCTSGSASGRVARRG